MFEDIQVWDWLQWWSLFMFLVFTNSLVGSVVKGEQKTNILIGFLLLMGPLFLRIWNVI
jgi:hypothetical protein